MKRPTQAEQIDPILARGYRDRRNALPQAPITEEQAWSTPAVLELVVGADGVNKYKKGSGVSKRIQDREDFDNRKKAVAPNSPSTETIEEPVYDSPEEEAVRVALRAELLAGYSTGKVVRIDVNSSPDDGEEIIPVAVDDDKKHADVA